MKTTHRPLQLLSSLNQTTSLKTHVETCVSILKNITCQGLVTKGSAFHAHLIKMGTSSERYISVKLLIMYLTHKKYLEANEIAKKFSNLIVNNCFISAYVQQGYLDKARHVFDQMPERNEVTWTAMISGFMKYGRVEESMQYFERNPFGDVFSWTATISGFVQNGFCFEAMELFLKLVKSGIKPNEITFTTVVKACAELGDCRLGLSLICLIVKIGFECNLSVANSIITLCVRIGEMDMARRVFDMMENKDVVSWTAILDMYAQIGDLGEARRIFVMMPERNEVSWSAMIARYSQSGYPEESLKLFRQMIQEGIMVTASCFSSVLSALGSVKALHAGMNIHGHIVKIGNEGHYFVCCSLIDFYCNCGKIDDGRLVFDRILDKNVVSWNAMIGGYGMNCQMEEAKALFDSMPLRNKITWSSMIAGYVDSKQFDLVFEVYNKMLLSGEVPNQSTFSSLLCACASTASLETGKDLHGKIIKFGTQYNVFVGTALTDMYAKSGDIDSSRKIFDRMPEKNEITWTVMIQGLAESGFAEESLNLFEMMKETSIAPNELMLLSVLFACSHSGSIDEGLQHFNAMQTVYSIKPKGKHYTCIVDMLSRAGRLSEAEEFINSMPFQPEKNAWAALLSGCKTYKNEELAERTVKKLWNVTQKNSAAYVLLSNIYASSGRWKDVQRIRKLMGDKGLKKTGGCSWVEVRNQVHYFYSDGSHTHLDEIYDILDLLRTEIRSL